MPTIEPCVSSEQIPHLEPLGSGATEPSSETNSVHDPSSTMPSSPPPPFLGTPPRSTAMSHNICQLMKNLPEPTKLSLVLENKGNVARDHLASERTYLAYVRTSLACASAGVALVQLFTLTASGSVENSGINLSKFAKPLGAAIIIFALIILAVGSFRYFSTQSALVRGYFPVARNSITAIAFVLGTLVGIVFAIIIAGTRS